MRNYIFAVLVFILSINPLLAQDQVLLKDGKVAVVFNSSTDTGETIEVKGLKFDHTKAFVLENPYRIVVDIFGASQKLHAKLPVQKALTVETLRLAFHPDHVRLVVDFLPNQAPKYAVEEAAGLITLRLKSATTPIPSPVPTTVVEVIAPIPTQVTDTIVPEVVVTESNLPHTPTAAPTVNELPSPTVSAPLPTPLVSAGMAVTLAVPTIPPATAVPTIHKAPERAWNNPGAHQIVSTIEFVTATGQPPVIRFVLSDKPEFNLIKRNETLYHLIIPDGSLSSAILALPQFPPHDFQAFDMVAPLQKGTNTEISIVVDRGIKLGAFPKGNEILVKPLNR